MREQILKLRAEGKSYPDIARLVPCAISTVWYHCTEGAKQKRIKLNHRDTKKLRYEIKAHFGGKCQICDYNKCFDALEFHHKDASDKESDLGRLISNGSTILAYKEAEKCLLVCANCHRELHFQLKQEA